MRLPKPPQPWPRDPPPGPFRDAFWKSPLRGAWLTSLLGSALLPLITICAVTGFLSHLAYHPELGDNSVFGQRGILGIDFYWIGYPANPAWIYAFTQGTHIATGLAAIPILIAKLWSVMPRLFEWPPLRSPAHSIERLSLLMLVGGSIFVFLSGLWNIQNWYPWPFNFVASHYFGAIIFLAGLGFHLVVKLPVALREFRSRGLVRPLRASLAETEPERHQPGSLAPADPAPATISRRGLIATIAAGSGLAALMGIGQSLGGPLRDLALLGPRGRGNSGDGTNDFPVNKTFAISGIEQAATGPGWRVRLLGGSGLELSREQLLAMPQTSASLPIACVEGWSSTQEWSGVRLADLASAVGLDSPGQTLVESLQLEGSFRQATLSSGQAADSRTILALKVNGADLSADHGFPARVVAPAVPGLHCTKWVGSISFNQGGGDEPA